MDGAPFPTQRVEMVVGRLKRAMALTCSLDKCLLRNNLIYYITNLFIQFFGFGFKGFPPIRVVAVPLDSFS